MYGLTLERICWEDHSREDHVTVLTYLDASDRKPNPVGSHLAAETYPLKSHGSSKRFVFHRTTQCFCNRLSFLTAGKSQVELMTLITHDSVPINVLVNRDPAAIYVIAGPPINGMRTSLIHLFLSSHGK